MYNDLNEQGQYLHIMTKDVWITSYCVYLFYSSVASVHWTANAASLGRYQFVVQREKGDKLGSDSLAIARQTQS